MAKDLKIDKIKKKQLVDELIHYFLVERDEEIGNLSAELLLDFITEKVGKIYYNEGIKDSIAYLQNSIEDMHGLEKY